MTDGQINFALAWISMFDNIDDASYQYDVVDRSTCVVDGFSVEESKEIWAYIRQLIDGAA